MSDTFSPTRPGPRFAALRALAGGWWLFMLRGVAAIAFGVIAFAYPLAGLAAALAVLAAWLAVDAVFTIAQAIRGRGEGGRAWLWVDGLASAAAAGLLLFAPGLSAVALVVIAGGWSIASGVFRMVLAFRARSALLGAAGALGVVVGAWMLLFPGPGLLALLWLVAAQAVVAGALLVGFAARLRRVHHDPSPG